MKKILILMLALLLCLPTAVACQKNDETPTPPPAPAPAPAPVIDTALTIATQEASEYQIVIAKDAEEYVEDYAYKLRLIIRSFLGVTLPIVYDTEPVQEKEIVFGKTNRQDLYTLPLDYKDGYVVCVCDQRLIFEARTASMMKTAASTFVRKFFGVSIDFVDVGKTQMIESFKVAPDYMISNDTAALYQVIYDGSYMQKRYAYQFQDQLKAISMSSVVMVDTKVNGNAPQITMEEDSTLERGHWRIEVAADQKSFKAFARDYYGFTAVSKYLIREIRKAQKNVYPFEANAVLTGSYVELLEKTEASAAYAYNRTGEYRVMFYNALWGNNSGTRRDANGKLWNDVPAAERNRLQAIMIAEYMPDVLGCQEFNWDKRGGAKENDLTVLLAELGYVETVDPRVKNMIPVEEGGYGTGGGRQVTVGDETFYTLYNCDPLFYNQNTTRCLESSYFWFPSQVDENTGELGAGECASKASTWGVFESLETGERYIVVSGHFRFTESVQLNQAKEIAAEIAKLVEKYDCPVFLGGDFNGRTHHDFYSYLTEELDYVSMQDSAIAKQFTSTTVTTHGYPCYDKEIGIMTDGGGTVSQISNAKDGDSIDKIFVSNYENASLEIFGVIVDECSLSAADHLPMVIDFSINS